MKVLCFLLLSTCVFAIYAAPNASAESAASNESGVSSIDASTACLNTYNQAQDYNNQQITSQINACLQSPISVEQDLGTQKSCVSHVLGHAKTNLGNAVDAYNKCLESILDASTEQ